MARNDPRLDMLSAVELFSECSKRELGQILAVAKEIDFDEGDNICVQGEPSGRFYLILNGSVAVKRNGRTRATLGRGDYFGEIALIDGQARTATCTAVTPVRTLAIAQFNFVPLMKEHAGLSHKLLLHLCSRLRAAEALLTD
ncbi:MAG TPA: cyclic nucleotide-binding domain-containing protein [Acidimicrobiales bacterium]|nr:cyclic nucleotide-binding domain-containing protein [Acidimicrobiales bacterium]